VQLSQQLLILVNLDLVMFIVVDFGMQFQLLAFQLIQIFILVPDQLVQPLYLLRQQYHLVLVIFHLRVHLFVLLEFHLHFIVALSHILQLTALCAKYVV
jgi:hypothetical protein